MSRQALSLGGHDRHDEVLFHLLFVRVLCNRAFRLLQEVFGRCLLLLRLLLDVLPLVVFVGGRFHQVGEGPGGDPRSCLSGQLSTSSSSWGLLSVTEQQLLVIFLFLLLDSCGNSLLIIELVLDLLRLVLDHCGLVIAGMSEAARACDHGAECPFLTTLVLHGRIRCNRHDFSLLHWIARAGRMHD